MKLSEKIYTHRKKAGLSQEALAEKLGVSRQAVSKWETGEATPELSKIPAMAKIFGVTADFLLSDDDTSNESEYQKPPHEAKKENHTYSFTTPEWVDNIPDALGNFFCKYGWILGIIVAVIGGGMMLANGFLLIFSVATTTGTGFVNPFLIVDIIGLLCGIVILITGIWLTRYLKKKSK